MGGEPRVAPNAGHVDLSMTRHVLQALAAADVPSSDPAFARARVFVERCQNPDGGFFFSTVNLDTNKAGEDAGRYRSYGSTTADGIISLRACGVPNSDPRLNRAARWLSQNHLPDRVPGFDAGPRAAWSLGLRYYYAAALIRAGWTHSLVEQILKLGFVLFESSRADVGRIPRAAAGRGCQRLSLCHDL
jgi:hypothetical protein